MNQIISFGFLDDNNSNSNKPKKTIFIYRIILYVSIFFIIGLITYYFTLYIKIAKIQKVSNQILDAYDIQKLYANNEIPSKPNIVLENGKSAEILGIISINNINLRYPILSDISEDFLEISPCKFYGNKLNDFGNFCIAGHNYDNGDFFSNLNLLNIGDVIDIYNLDRFLSILSNL